MENEADNDMIECEGHGQQPTTLVCKHLAEPSEDGPEIGYHWSATDGELVANCSACEANVGEDGFLPEPYVIENFVLMCRECFIELAADNGVEADEIVAAEAEAKAALG